MRQGYFSFLLEASSTEDLGGSYFGALALALPLPFSLPLEALFAAVDWTICTSEVLLGLDEFLEGLLEPVFETYFCFQEYFTKV